MTSCSIQSVEKWSEYWVMYPKRGSSTSRLTDRKRSMEFMACSTEASFPARASVDQASFCTSKPTGLVDALADLGAVVVGPVATVEDALTLVERVPEIDGAVLDVNLGREVAYPVADALLARGVPFLFATANDRADIPERFAHVVVCRKPFRAEAFRDAVAALRAPPARRVA